MSWVGLPLLLIGVLYAVGLIVSVVRSFHDPHYIVQAALVGLAMLFYLPLGVWTNQAAEAFARIGSTQGRDIHNLMDALENLRRVYGLVSLLVKVYVVLVLVAVVIGLIAVIIGPAQS
jgi:hypothetical protein